MWPFLLPFLLLLGGTSEAASPDAPAPTDPVRLVEIVGPRTLKVGGVGHFRARVSDASGRPVNYLWDLGDGTLSIGALVSYAYAAPGSYTVTVVARNAAGRDTLKVPVHVEAAPTRAGPEAPAAERRGTEEASPAAAPDGAAPRPPRIRVPRTALYGGGGVALEKGGYAWVVATDLWAERARDRMLRYRLRGFRADVYADTAGRGSIAYRVLLGQFETRRDALAARPWVPDAAKGAWLLELPPVSKAAPQNRK